MKKLIALVALSFCLGSCANTKNMGTADMCLFQDKPAKVHVEFEGAQVGFCCDKCKGKFEAMDAAAKKAAVAKRAK